MRLTVAAIGRMKPGPMKQLADEYQGRMNWPVIVREIDIRQRLSPAELTEREGEALLAIVPAGSRVVVLDERGKALNSRAFASQLGRWRDDGAADCAFLLGGADGHAGAVRRRADLLLSFGSLTWPHMLARVMVLEQLYRAQQILAGHPYHRD